MAIIEDYMFHPGKIETWVLLIDVNNITFPDFPFEFLRDVIKEASQNFPSALDELYILKPSLQLNLLWSKFERKLFLGICRVHSLSNEVENYYLKEIRPVKLIKHF
jgi:hypothetical protein